ncbi:MAG: WYL domain-containing protein [Mogibacterium sp.]|nr:WYL domain-containing protein [Mogibacterium sp.]
MARSERKKLRILFVAEILKKRTDENHPISVQEIIDILEDDYEIEAERKAVGRDIRILRDVFNMDIEGGQGSKYRLMSREFDFEELKIIIECLHASRFLSDGKTSQLVNILRKEFMSEHQAEQITNDVFLSSGAASLTKSLMFNISQIYTAMSKRLDGKPHTPQKISFKYASLRLSKNGKAVQKERNKGAVYVVSPYQLVIDNDYYYLIAFDDKSQEIRNYRVDRMKNIQLLEEPRDGKDAFKELNIKDYVEKTFSMYSGEPQTVRIRFIGSLYETVAERFGNNASYFYEDEHHFTVQTKVNISDQFFSWICGFRKSAEILFPPAVVEDFNKFLKDIQSKY